MTAEKYLEQIATCKTRIKNKADEVEELQALSTNISPHLSDMHVQSTPDPHRAQEVWVKLAEARLELIREVLELLMLKESIIHTLEKVGGREYDVLYGLYVLGLPPQKVADRTFYSRRTIYHIKDAGLAKLQKIIDSDESLHKISQHCTPNV